MFSHLHVHTEFSLLDGMCRIPELVAAAKRFGLDSLAITDHGAMHGAIKFYGACREAGIKPIIGCELYVAHGSRFEHTTLEKSPYHIVLLAKNAEGYQNLIELVTAAHLEGFYYKPRVDKELLKKHSKGLVALSACLAGEIASLIKDDRLEEAKKAALWYKETFKDYYLELQRHAVPELDKVNPILVSFSRELNIPLVATGDVHYLNREDAPTHDILLCIGTGSTVNDAKRMRMEDDSYFLKDPDEMAELFKDIPEAIENTEKIAQECNLELQFGKFYLPEIEIPSSTTPIQFLRELCYEGLKRVYPEVTSEITERLEYELSVIDKTNFANYFLVVWDITSFAKKKGILFGVRGSAAASIVLYCLGITRVDPLKYRLVFERFLNIERKEMPDIDLDFEDGRRDEVLSYVVQRYGSDHVAQIITFGTLGARAAVRDVGRALGMRYGDVDRVARLVPFNPGMTLERALQESPELKDLYGKDFEIRKLIDSSKKVEGLARHASTHAAGVVISKEPLTKYMPLQRPVHDSDMGIVMTQLPMEDVARVGLLKMDFLGLINLTIIRLAREMIKESTGEDVDIDHLPLDDVLTYQLLSRGDTVGVFQLEGSGMRRFIRELKPSNFGDIAAMVALYRPGPMEQIPRFIRAKHGLEKVSYPHPILSNILEETYGVIVYQDQVLLIVREFAGYSLGQADIFRKAMGKKIPEVMQREKRNFIAGAAKRGFSDKLAEDVYSLIEPFAGYAFNKAHATSYALLAYETAYLKAHYPVQYMAALLQAYNGQTAKIASAIGECRRLGVKVLPPDINKSELNFSIEKTLDGTLAIRFGLTAIKNVGGGAVEPIIRERKTNGEYSSVEDFCRRSDLGGVSRKVLESLIKAGAFDSLGERGALLSNLGTIISLAQRFQKLKQSGQVVMFDLWGDVVPAPTPTLELKEIEVSPREKLGWEKELMGVAFSGGQNSVVKTGTDDAVSCGQIDAEMEGETVTVVGMVSSLQNLLTKRREEFISAQMEDLEGSVEVMVFPRLYGETKDLWKEGNTLKVRGKVRGKEDGMQIIAVEASLFGAEEPPKIEVDDNKPGPTTPKSRRRLVITLDQTRQEAEDVALLHRVIELLGEFPGDDEVLLMVNNGTKIFELGLPGIKVEICPELERGLIELVSEGRIRVEEA